MYCFSFSTTITMWLVGLILKINIVCYNKSTLAELSRRFSFCIKLVCEVNVLFRSLKTDHNLSLTLTKCCETTDRLQDHQDSGNAINPLGSICIIQPPLLIFMCSTPHSGSACSLFTKIFILAVQHPYCLATALLTLKFFYFAYSTWLRLGKA